MKISREDNEIDMPSGPPQRPENPLWRWGKWVALLLLILLVSTSLSAVGTQMFGLVGTLRHIAVQLDNTCAKLDKTIWYLNIMN